MQILKLALDNSSNTQVRCLKWTGKNSESFLQIATKEFGVDRISEFPCKGWLFFPTFQGELLVRKGGWIVKFGSLWHSIPNEIFKKSYTVLGEIECPEYADNEE